MKELASKRSLKAIILMTCFALATVFAGCSSKKNNQTDAGNDGGPVSTAGTGTAGKGTGGKGTGGGAAGKGTGGGAAGKGTGGSAGGTAGAGTGGTAGAGTGGNGGTGGTCDMDAGDCDAGN
jgi:hypothetical protein